MNLLEKAHHARLAGRFADAVRLYERGILSARTPTDRADARAGRGMALRGLCRYREALAEFRRAATVYRREGDLEGAGFVAYGRGGALRFLGRFRQAEVELKRALRLAGDDTDEAFTLMALAGMYRMTGRYMRSLELYRRALGLGERLEDRYIQAYAHCGVGNAYRMTGVNADARRHLRRAESLYRAIGDRVSRPYTLVALAFMDASAGRPVDAAEPARLFRATGDHRGLVHVRLFRAAFEPSVSRREMESIEIERIARRLGLRLEALHARFVRAAGAPSVAKRLAHSYRAIGARIPPSILRLP